MERWAVCTAKVYFEDSPNEFKIRPVIILGDRGFVCESLKVTSQPKNDSRHIKLSQWQAAGLDKPSWVDISKTIRIPPEEIMGEIGILDSEDVFNIIKALNRRA